MSVEGPAGIVKSRDIAYYTVTFSKPEQAYNLEFLWTVSAGRIAKGQGTTRIGVVQPEASLTATVEVKGLPENCVHVFSETSGSGDGLPLPKKLDQFSSRLDATIDKKFQDIAQETENNPSSQLYVFVPTDQNARESFLVRLDRISPGQHFDTDRITFVETSKGSKLIQVWLVPPGATPPEKCEDCENSNKQVFTQGCPSLEVTGPAGVTRPGTTMTFTVTVPGTYKGNYLWTVSAGTIENGMGTRAISVRVPADAMIPSITATVELAGLHVGCKNVASEMGFIDNTGDALPFDSYNALSPRMERDRLKNLAIQLVNSPGDIAVFLLSVPKRGSKEAFDKRKKVISNYLTQISIKDDRIRFILGTRDSFNTEIYVVPPNAAASLPK